MAVSVDQTRTGVLARARSASRTTVYSYEPSPGGVSVNEKAPSTYVVTVERDRVGAGGRAADGEHLAGERPPGDGHQAAVELHGPAGVEGARGGAEQDRGRVRGREVQDPQDQA